jgi:hypothetical protein
LFRIGDFRRGFLCGDTGKKAAKAKICSWSHIPKILLSVLEGRSGALEWYCPDPVLVRPTKQINVRSARSCLHSVLRYTLTVQLPRLPADSPFPLLAGVRTVLAIVAQPARRTLTAGTPPRVSRSSEFRTPTGAPARTSAPNAGLRLSRGATCGHSCCTKATWLLTHPAKCC